MGLLAIAGVFASIARHELAHALVARAYGIRIGTITLWLLGGVTEMEDEPPSAMAELAMAAAGPLLSLALAYSALS